MPPRTDIAGKKFGMLTTTEYVGNDKRGHALWGCICDCGNETVVRAYHLKEVIKSNGLRGIKSCGCLGGKRTHGYSRPGQHPEYKAWQHLKSRCLNVNDKKYPRYGGRGIKVCDHWLNSFDNFLVDMGHRPGKGYSIDRIDVDRDYEPENCRWATAEQQMNNASTNIYIHFRGREYTLPQIMRKFVVQNLDEETFRLRLNKGWGVEDVFFTPYYGKERGKVPIYIAGAGGFARESAYVLSSSIINFEDVEVIYLSDSLEQKGEDIVFGSVKGSIEEQDIKLSKPRFIVSVGVPRIKQELSDRMIQHGFSEYGPVVHKTTAIGPDVEIGIGTIICSMCSITTNVKIGKFVNINLNCTIGHDAVIEDYVNLTPHCTISGNVHIEKYCDLGSGVDVVPGVTIGEGSIIGAGAVVTKDIPPHSLAIGVPAKVVKTLKE